MADSGGVWKTLTEARKLTESTKIPGVFETDIKRLNPAELMPIVQAGHSGKSIKFLREKNFSEEAVEEVDIGQQMTWSEDVEYDEIEVYMKRLGIQRPLDQFHPEIHGTFNDYRAIALLDMEKKVMRRIGDRIIYGDYTYNDQWDGVHALAAERGTAYSGTINTGSTLNIDNGNGTGLSLQYLRIMINAMLFGCDQIWMPDLVAQKMDAAYQEKGFVGLATGTAGNLGYINQTWNELGQPVLMFGGRPIMRTDYLMTETVNAGTGASSNARTKDSSSSGEHSIFGVKYGNVLNKEPGLCLGIGGTSGEGDLYKLTHFPVLEDFDAEGFRMIVYGAVLLGSYLCLGRIFDVDGAEDLLV